MATDVGVFGWQDYLVFSAMLLLSAAIGLYYAYKDRRGKEGVQGYLLASRQMNFFPVAVSISLSFVSSVTVLGVPAEIYYYGSMYTWLIGATIWVGPVVSEIYIPLFYRLNVASVFEGGLKAVIWTDVFQGGVLIIGSIVTLVAAVNDVEGFHNVWEACQRGGRIEFDNINFDPRERTTVWSMTIGLGFLWLSVFGTNQSQVQRYFSCKTETEAKKGFVTGLFIAISCLVILILTGFATYAYFETCDPVISKEIVAADQIVPLMVLKIFKDQPGLPGLFVAGLFAGCLSTVSSGINALACVAVKDFIQPFMTRSSRVMTVISKGMVFVFGALSIGFAILASQLGNVLQASLTALGLVGGPLLGIFTLGILFPCATSWGAGIGLAAGFALPTWIYIGTYIYPVPPQFLGLKPYTISGCNLNVTPGVNSTTEAAVTSTMQSNTAERPAIAEMYAVSYAYYAAIGFGVSVIVGLIVSILTRGYEKRKTVDPKLVMPIFDHVIFSWLPSSFRKCMWCGLTREEPESKDEIYAMSYTQRRESAYSLGDPPRYSERVLDVRDEVDKKDDNAYDNDVFVMTDGL